MVSVKIFFYDEEFLIQQVVNLNSLSNIRKESVFSNSGNYLFPISHLSLNLLYSINLALGKNCNTIIMQCHSIFLLRHNN